MKIITRKTMLYKTGVEYGDYTMNHVLGCAHGCKYPCYAFQMKKRFGEVKDYNDWCEPKLVSNTLELLDKEIPKLKGKIKSVFLCFSTDPFMYGYPEVAEMSLQAIKKLNDAGIVCKVLTKGVLPTKLGFLVKANELGISLVSLDEDFRQKYEPNTVDYQSRILALRTLHNFGCKTWVSMEPYPTPNIIDQAHWKIIEEVRFVDKIVFGKLNYNKAVTEYLRTDKNFYNEVAREVKNLCKLHGIECRIKRGTLTEGKS